MTRVLVVDDEPQILRALQITLRARLYDVVTAADGAAALRSAASSRPPDVVVLDLGLPDMDGVEVVRALRAASPVPILVLSGRMDSRVKVDALDAGADDYVTKPFAMEELLARLRALTRRAGGPVPPTVVRLGRHLVDLDDRSVRSDDVDQGPVHLTPTEWNLLDVLLRSPGRLVSQRRLLLDVWGPAYGTETHYLRQYMKHLRRKLEEEPSRPRHLVTEPGLGYRFQP